MPSDVMTIRGLFDLEKKPRSQEQVEELINLQREEETLTALMSSMNPRDAAEIRGRIDQFKKEVNQNTDNPDDEVICQWNSLYRVPVIAGQKTQGLHPFLLKRKDIPTWQWRNKLVVICTSKVVVPVKEVEKVKEDDKSEGRKATFGPRAKKQESGEADSPPETGE